MVWACSLEDKTSPVSSALYNLHPWYWNSLLYGENSVHFLQLMPFTIFQFFVPPGTHYCWVSRGSMEWEVCPTLLHMATHDQQWESNPRPSDLISTWQQAPKVSGFLKLSPFFSPFLSRSYIIAVCIRGSTMGNTSSLQPRITHCSVCKITIATAIVHDIKHMLHQPPDVALITVHHGKKHTCP